MSAVGIQMLEYFFLLRIIIHNECVYSTKQAYIMRALTAKCLLSVHMTSNGRITMIIVNAMADVDK